MNDTAPTSTDAPGKPELILYTAGARLAIPCECAQRGYVDNDDNPAKPDPMQCGACGSFWCARCHPTPAARCPFEYEHEDPDLEPLPLGCAVAGTATRRGEETSALIVQLALDRGWFPSPYGVHGCHRKEAAEVARLLLHEPDTGMEVPISDGERADAEEVVGELAREAAAYLDSQAVRQTEHHKVPTRVVHDDGLQVVTAEEYNLLYNEDCEPEDGMSTHTPDSPVTWESSNAQSGTIALNTEGSTTILVHGEPVIGIDMCAGTVFTWPDGEHHEVVARFTPHRDPDCAACAYRPDSETDPVAP